MEGGSRRPYRPLQVVGVLAAVLSTALISLQFTPPDERAGVRPIPDIGTLGERLNPSTIAIVADNFLKGIDLGITQSIILNEFRENGEVGNIDDKIDYITKLFNEEMHVVVRADSGISSIAELNGKKVNFSDIGSGSQLSSRDIFRRLGIAPQEVNMGQGDALEKLKTGELAANETNLAAVVPGWTPLPEARIGQSAIAGARSAAEEPPGGRAILADPRKTNLRTITSLCDIGA